MPILASTTYVNAYGKSSLIAVETVAGILNSMRGGDDVFIVKYNTLGKALWSARVGSINTDQGFAITTDSNGNVYATGLCGSGSSTSIYNADGTPFGTLVNAGNFDAFITKYNTTGIVQWVTRVSSSASDIGYSITTDSSGNVYASVGGGSGTTITVFNSDGTTFGTTFPNSGTIDAYIVKYNTTGTVQWVARIASTSSDVAFGIATDSSGNVYVTGQGGSGVVVTAFSSNGVAFGTTLANSGNTDAFIVKYDTSGTVQWVARVASTSADIGYAIATDSSGNVYVTGQGGVATVTAFSSNGVAFGTTLANAGSGDAFIVKYDTSGTVQWVARVASTATDTGYGIATDSSGNVYVTGVGGSGVVVTAFSSNGVAFGTTLANSGNTDAFIVKYDTSGIVQWVAKIASTAADIGYAIATDSSGNVYVTGQGGSGVVVTAFSSDGTAFGTTLANSGGTDAFIVKYDTSGTVQWVARIASSGGDIARGLAIDSGGNTYITGQFGGTSTYIYGQSFGLFSTLPNSGGRDAYIVKYNTNGAPQWVARIASLGDDTGYGIDTDSAGNVYVIGQGGGASVIVTAFSSNGVAFSPTLANSGNGDAFIVKYNTSGIVQWVAKIGSTAADIGYAIAIDSSGNVYVTGQGGSGVVVTAFSSDGTAFGTTLANSGNNDAFIVKYDTSGIVQWVARVASTAADIGYGITTDSSGNVYVTGQGGSGVVVTAFSSNGTAFGTALANSGGSDAFIVKYDTSGTVQWVARVGSTDSDTGFAIATDSSGNVYVTGQGGLGVVVTAFSSNGTAFGTTLPNSGNSDAFIVKYNTSGIVQWVARIASTVADIGYGIATDSTGNVYVTGQSGGSLATTAFSSNGVAFGTTLPASGAGDVFIAKYNTGGIVQWVAKIGSTATDIGYGIATDSIGNVYISVNTGALSGIFTASSANQEFFAEVFGSGGLFKYDTNGFGQWAQMIRGATSTTNNRAVTTDATNNVYITGGSAQGETTQIYNADNTIYRVLNSTRLNDTYIVKYSANTTPLWVAKIASTATDNGFAIATDSSGNVYVTGQGGSGVVVTAFSSNGVAFGTTLANSGNTDAFIVKYDTSGIVQWVAQVASTAADIGYAIATDSSGNVYVTGQGRSTTVTAFSSNGVAFVTTLTLTGAFIVKYNTSGIVQWVAQVASSGQETGFGISTDSSGNVYIGGQLSDTATTTAFSSNGTAFGTTIGNSGLGDAFIVKYDTSGIVQWVARVGSTATDGIYAIAGDSSGNVYVTGFGGSGAVVTAFSSNGVAFGTTLANSGSNDVFIVKYNTSGTVQWVARVASIGTDSGWAIAADSSGNVYVTGEYSNTLTAFSSNGVAFGTTLAFSGNTDVFTVKYNASGIVQWVARIASSGTDAGYGIATDSSGSVYVTGTCGSSGTITSVFNSDGTLFGSASITVTGTNSAAFIVKYNTTGSVQWVSSINGSGNDIGRAIALDSSNNIYTTGTFITSGLIPFSA